MSLDSLYAAVMARSSNTPSVSPLQSIGMGTKIPSIPRSNGNDAITPSALLMAAGEPMPEINTGEAVTKALDYPRNVLFKILSGIDKERVGGTDVLEKIGMKPGMRREALGLVMDTGADPMNALTGVPNIIKKIKDVKRAADLAKSTKTIAPLIGEGVSASRSNLLDALNSPAFRRQGRSIADMTGLSGPSTPLPSSLEIELAESLDTPGAGMVDVGTVPKSGASVPKKGTVKTKKKSKATDILTGQK